jgi:hypothetical protein
MIWKNRIREPIPEMEESSISFPLAETRERILLLP